MSGAQARFEAELAAGRFMIQRCGACARHLFYPREICPHCGRTDQLAWVEPTGHGTVYSTTTVRIDPKAPHEVCLVDLDEGVRMMSTVRGIEPGSLRIGTRVKASLLAAAAAQPAMVVFDIDDGGATAATPPLSDPAAAVGFEK